MDHLLPVPGERARLPEQGNYAQPTRPADRTRQAGVCVVPACFAGVQHDLSTSVNFLLSMGEVISCCLFRPSRASLLN